MEIILSTSNPYELLDTIENKDYTGIYFLDIDLNSNINGIDLAKKIRCYDPRGFIIFVTIALHFSGYILAQQSPIDPKIEIHIYKI